MTIIRTQATIRLPMPINEADIHQKIKTLESAEEKRELIRQTNPLYYIFGEKQTAYIADEDNQGE